MGNSINETLARYADETYVGLQGNSLVKKPRQTRYRLIVENDTLVMKDKKEIKFSLLDRIKAFFGGGPTSLNKVNAFLQTKREELVGDTSLTDAEKETLKHFHKVFEQYNRDHLFLKIKNIVFFTFRVTTAPGGGGGDSSSGDNTQSSSNFPGLSPSLPSDSNLQLPLYDRWKIKDMLQELNQLSSSDPGRKEKKAALLEYMENFKEELQNESRVGSQELFVPIFESKDENIMEAFFNREKLPPTFNTLFSDLYYSASLSNEGRFPIVQHLVKWGYDPFSHDGGRSSSNSAFNAIIVKHDDSAIDWILDNCEGEIPDQDRKEIVKWSQIAHRPQKENDSFVNLKGRAEHWNQIVNKLIKREMTVENYKLKEAFDKAKTSGSCEELKQFLEERNLENASLIDARWFQDPQFPFQPSLLHAVLETIVENPNSEDLWKEIARICIKKANEFPKGDESTAYLEYCFLCKYKTPLLLAIEIGDEELVQTLLAKGEAVEGRLDGYRDDQRPHSTNDVLFHPIEALYGDTSGFSTEEDRGRILQTLIEAGSDPFVQNHAGEYFVLKIIQAKDRNRFDSLCVNNTDKNGIFDQLEKEEEEKILTEQKEFLDKLSEEEQQLKKIFDRAKRGGALSELKKAVENRKNLQQTSVCNAKGILSIAEAVLQGVFEEQDSGRRGEWKEICRICIDREGFTATNQVILLAIQIGDRVFMQNILNKSENIDRGNIHPLFALYGLFIQLHVSRTDVLLKSFSTGFATKEDRLQVLQLFEAQGFHPFFFYDFEVSKDNIHQQLYPRIVELLNKMIEEDDRESVEYFLRQYKEDIRSKIPEDHKQSLHQALVNKEWNDLTSTLQTNINELD